MAGNRNVPRRHSRISYHTYFSSTDDSESSEDDVDNGAITTGNQTVLPGSPRKTYIIYASSSDDSEATSDNSEDSDYDKGGTLTSENDDSTAEGSVTELLDESLMAIASKNTDIGVEENQQAISDAEDIEKDSEGKYDNKEIGGSRMNSPGRSPWSPLEAVPDARKSRLVTLGTEETRKTLAEGRTRTSRAIRRIASAPAAAAAPAAPQMRQSLPRELKRRRTDTSGVSVHQQPRKQRYLNHHESQSRPNKKRPQKSKRRDAGGDTETEASRATEPEVKEESEDDIQIISEQPASTKTSIHEGLQGSRRSSSVEFLKSFIAAGKLATIARMAVPFNRKGNIKVFREHLVVADCRDFDEAVADITENDDAAARLMTAEYLSDVLGQRLSWYTSVDN